MFNAKYETQRVLKRLLQGEVGDVITADEMKAIMGVECWPAKSKGYPYVRSAINMAINQRVFWYRDKNALRYVRGPNVDINRASKQLIVQSGKRAKRSLTILLCADDATMTPEEKRDHSLSAILSGTIANAASTKVRKQLEAVPQEKKNPTTQELLGLLVSKPNGNGAGH